MKKNIANNFGELLNPNTAKAQEPVKGATKKEKTPTKPVCYSIPTETADKIRQIAAWDRKTINTVVAEALEYYAAKWKPANSEPPKF